MSELKFPCPKCSQTIVCDTANIGASLSCPSCHQAVTVPAAASSVPPPPAVPDTEQSFLSGVIQIPWATTPASQAPGAPLSPAAQQQTGKKPH